MIDRVVRVSLIVLNLFPAINALIGAIWVIPGLPLAWLEGSPFTSYRIPALTLAIFCWWRCGAFGSGAGAVRLTQLAGGTEIMPANPRFSALPLPVVLHIVSASVFAILGAFQFATGFRRRSPRWHRVAGRLLVAYGLLVWRVRAVDDPVLSPRTGPVSCGMPCGSCSGRPRVVSIVVSSFLRSRALFVIRAWKVHGRLSARDRWALITSFAVAITTFVIAPLQINWVIVPTAIWLIARVRGGRRGAAPA